MISADGSSCIPCSGIGAVLTDDVCTCGENAENNEGNWNKSKKNYTIIITYTEQITRNL